MAETRENTEVTDPQTRYDEAFTTSNIEQLTSILYELDPNMTGPPEQEVPSPEMELHVTNRMIRLRYDSELSNRNKGKEELIKVSIKNYAGPVCIRMQTVDIRNHKAHPFCLIGEDCKDGVYIKEFNIDSANSCICKATLRIPRRTEYEKVLKDKYIAFKDHTFGIPLDQMKGGDYWTCNKNIKECTDFRLHVEAFIKIGDEFRFLEKISEPLSNAKDGKKFDIHRVCPFAVPCTGIPEMQHSLVIILTADSYIPKKVKVIFSDDEGWTANSSSTNIIKNVIECTVPPYKDINLMQPKDVRLVVEDVQKQMQTTSYDMQYRASMADQDTTGRKRKKPTSYTVPEQLHIPGRHQKAALPSTSSSTKHGLKNKLKQKIGLDTKKPGISTPNLSGACSQTWLTTSNSGPSSMVSSAVTQDVSLPQAPFQSFIPEQEDPQFEFNIDPSLVSLANILAPSGVSMSGDDTKPPPEFIQNYQNILNGLQNQQQQQQQQHALMPGNQDIVYQNTFHPPSSQTRYRMVNPTTLQPPSQTQSGMPTNNDLVDLSDLDFNDIEIDAASNRVKAESMLDEKAGEMLDKVSRKSQDDDLDKNSDSSKNDTNKKTDNVDKVSKNENTNIVNNRDQNGEATKGETEMSKPKLKTEKSESLECKELKEALPSDDLESDGC